MSLNTQIIGFRAPAHFSTNSERRTNFADAIQKLFKKTLESEKTCLRLLPQDSVREDWDRLVVKIIAEHSSRPYNISRCFSPCDGHEDTMKKLAPAWEDQRIFEIYPKRTVSIGGHSLEMTLRPLERRLGLIRDPGFQISICEPKSLTPFIQLSVCHLQAEMPNFSATSTISGKEGLRIVRLIAERFDISSIKVEDGATTSKCFFQKGCTRALVVRRVLGILTNETGFYEKFGAHPIGIEDTMQYANYAHAVREIFNDHLRSSFVPLLHQWKKNAFTSFHYQQAVSFLQAHFKLVPFMEDLKMLLTDYPELAPLHELLAMSVKTNPKIETLSDLGSYLKAQALSSAEAHENWHSFQEYLVANRESICFRLYHKMLNSPFDYDPRFIETLSYLIIGAMRTFYSIPEHNSFDFYTKSLECLTSTSDPFCFARHSGLNPWPSVFDRHVKEFVDWAKTKKNAWAQAVSESSTEQAIKTYRIYDELLEPTEEGLSFYFMALKYLKVRNQKDLDTVFKKSYETSFLANKILGLMQAYKNHSLKTSPGSLYLLFKLSRLLVEWQENFRFNLK